MNEHLHTTIVPGCYRCDLGRDEELMSVSDQLQDALTSAWVLRIHTPSLGYLDGTPVLVCRACPVRLDLSDQSHPCPDWTRASEALGE